MLYHSSFVTGFLSGQRLKRWQGGLASGDSPVVGISFYDWAAQAGAPAVLTDPDDYREAVQNMPYTITMDDSLIWQPTVADLFKENTCAFTAGNDKTQGFLIYFCIDRHIYPQTADNYSGSYSGSGSCEVTNLDGRSFHYLGRFLKYTSYYEGTWVGMFIQLRAPIAGVYKIDTTAPMFDGNVSVLNADPVHANYFFNAYQASHSAGETIKADRYIKRYGSSHTTCMSMVDGTLYLPVFEVQPTVTNPNLLARPGLLTGSPVSESALTFTNPITGEIIPFESYEYNYATRAYTLILSNGNKIDVTFGDNAIIINELGGGDGATSGGGGTMEALYPGSSGETVIAPPDSGNTGGNTGGIGSGGAFSAYDKAAFLAGLAAGMASAGG